MSKSSRKTLLDLGLILEGEQSEGRSGFDDGRCAALPQLSSSTSTSGGGPANGGQGGSASGPCDVTPLVMAYNASTSSTKLRRSNTDVSHSSQESIGISSPDSLKDGISSNISSGSSKHSSQDERDATPSRDCLLSLSQAGVVNAPAEHAESAVSEVTMVTGQSEAAARRPGSRPHVLMEDTQSQQHDSTNDLFELDQDQDDGQGQGPSQLQEAQPVDEEEDDTRMSAVNKGRDQLTPSSGRVNVDLERLKVELILRSESTPALSHRVVHSGSIDSQEGLGCRGELTACRSASDILCPLDEGTGLLAGIDTPGTHSSEVLCGSDALSGRDAPSNGQASDSSSLASPSGSFSKTPKPGSDKKKKTASWYSVLSPTYKTKTGDFRKTFKDIPNDERLIVDYSCALQKDILLQGRLYISQNWICFYANIFRWETVLMIRCKDIVSMTKEKTARVIPNAIQVCTKDERYFFTSFGTREKTYLMMFRVWQNALCDKVMTSGELWQWVRYSYGEELGLTSSDDDYIGPTQEEEKQFQARLQQEEKSMALTQEGGTKDDKEPTGDDSLLNGDVSSLGIPVAMAAADLPAQDAASSISTEDSFSMMEKTKMSLPQSEHSGPPQQHGGPPCLLQTPSMDHLSPELPTDLGDTTEDEEGEVTCSGHEHFDIQCVDEIMMMGADKCFELIFSDSQLQTDFTTARKTYDVMLGPWAEEPNDEGHKTRKLSYTLSLNYAIGPKSSPSTELQTMYDVSKPGTFYLIDTECFNSGIPYGDSFYVINRYCITRISNHKCRLKITSGIKYRKSVWGLVKNFIEKNATAGILDTFNCLGELLRDESSRHAQLQMVAGQPSGRKKVLRRRRHTPSERTLPSQRGRQDQMSKAVHAAPSQGLMTGATRGHHQGAHKAKEEWNVKLTADTLVRIVCAVLIVLVIFNAVLFYKLWSLESKAGMIVYTPKREVLITEKTPQSQDDWLHLLQQQRELHDVELDRWKDILTSSIQLIEQMKLTLTALQQSVENRTKFSSAATPPSGGGGGR